MTFVTFPSQIASWETKLPLAFPLGVLEKDRAYYCFIRTLTLPVAAQNQYLAIVAELDTSVGVFETPLEAKYFPSVNGMVFSIAIPDSDWDNEVGVTILLFPKEFGRGTAFAKELEIEVFYDDQEQKNIAIPVG